MGRYTKGILGAFRGKVGTVIGSSWRGIDYMRSLASRNKNRISSDKQLLQQARFGIMTKFLSPIRPLVEEGFKNFAFQKTGYNSALSYNVRNGIAGNYPILTLDYPAISFSKGDLTMAAAPVVAALPQYKVNFTWTDNSATSSARETDEVMVLVYSTDLQEAMFLIGGGERRDASITLDLPAHFVGSTVHTWIAFRSANGKEVSNSQYVGTAVVIVS